MEVPECPKCRSKMEDGFIKDEGYGVVNPSKWVEGKPVQSFWLGTRTSGKMQFEITTYRCTSCGYLESYAK
jgi:hypothetical protein